MKKLFVSIFLMVVFVAFAQVKTHEVQPKETLYGISKLYGITQDELKNANPFLSERGLQIGDVLNIPTHQSGQVSELPKQSVENHEDANFYYHVIQPKETLYTLAKQYDTTQEVIKSLNPFIDERGLQIDDIVRFPKKETETQETVVPRGMHQVKAGETVYSIAKQYNVEMADIYAYNRSVQTNGLKVGEFIKIPNQTIVQIPVTPEPTTPKEIQPKDTSQKKYFEHKVEKEETVFSILRKYDVTLNELIAVNPELQNGLQEGMTLRIPWMEGANIQDETTFVETNAANFSDNEINIVWMMPFFLDTPNAHKGERQVAQDFYMGGQIALDRLIADGKNVNIEIFDVQGNTDDLDAFLESDKFQNVDAVIGPFFQNMVAHVAQKLEHTSVPVFSPLINSEALDIYDNVYLTTPRTEFASDVIVEEMAKAYNGKQQVKILTTNKEENIANYVKMQFLERFGEADVIITKNPNDMNLVEHKNIITVGEGEEAEQVEEITYDPILAVLVSENNRLGKQFVNIVKEQDASSIDGFSVYFVPALDVFDRQNANNINALKNIGFTYTATRMVNTFGGNEKKIMKDFKERYCSNPSKYMSIGYDVVYDVIDRMDESGKISDFDAKRAETRLSSKIGYDKTENGNAKINKELRVIRLKK